MTGEQLYVAYCAALWVNWPRPNRAYTQIFAEQAPSPPVAWPFLDKFSQKGWDELAKALTNPESES